MWTIPLSAAGTSYSRVRPVGPGAGRLDTETGSDSLPVPSPLLHAEIDSVPEQAAPGFAELERLEYTRNVVDEALRLYPPGWMLSRRTIGADTLSGYEIPPGTDVLLCIYLLHRHPRYWKEPQAFRPERFWNW